MKIDPRAASWFLAALFKRSAAPVFVTSLANDRAAGGRIPPRQIVTRESERVENFVAKWDQPERAMYFCVATLRPGITRRAKANLHEIVCLHCDLDGKNIEAESLGAIHTAIVTPPSLLPPSIVVYSGHGLHAYWLLPEALPATDENIARVEAALKKLAVVFAGDPAVCECSRLMRLPGSHNTKNGGWVDVHVGGQRSTTYALDKLETWLATATQLLKRRPSPPRARNGGGATPTDPFTALGSEFVAPIDVDARLAEMEHHGPGEASIHNTQVSVTASLLQRGWPPDVVVARVLQATTEAAGPEGRGWDWAREKRALQKMCGTWLAKHPRVVFEIED